MELATVVDQARRRRPVGPDAMPGPLTWHGPAGAAATVPRPPRTTASDVATGRAPERAQPVVRADIAGSVAAALAARLTVVGATTRSALLESPKVEPGPTWQQIIRGERRRAGLTQVELGARAGLDPETIRKYERGSRLPSRESLERILEVLQVPVEVARRALIDRGFHHRGIERSAGYFFRASELTHFVEDAPWPRFVCNELGEVVAANMAATNLLGLHPAAGGCGHARASMCIIRVLAEPRLTERIANWEQVCSYFVGLLRRHWASRPVDDDDPDGPPEELVVAIASTNPTVLRRILRIWESTPPTREKIRDAYTIDWCEPGLPEIHLRGVTSPASEPDALTFHDWVPADAASHASLDEILVA